MPKKFEGLFIENSQEKVDSLIQELENSDIHFNFTRVADKASLIDALKNNQWDIIISNFDIPSFSGHCVLQILNENENDTPLIFVSENYTSQTAIEMMEAGAHDFVRKDDLARFATTVHRALQNTEATLKYKHELKKLRESEEKFKTVVNQSHEGMLITMKGSSTIVFSNPALQSLIECNEDKILSMTLEDILNMTHPADKQATLEHCSDLISGIGVVEDIEFSIQRKSGAMVWIQLKSRQIRYQGKPAILTTFLDITNRHLADDQMRQERDRAQSYLDIAGVMIVALDINGKVTLVNQKGSELLGLESRDIIGKDWIQVFTPLRNRRKMKRHFRNLRKGVQGQNEYIESPILTSSGEERIIAWHYTVITNTQGKIVGTLSSGEDITIRKKAEETTKAAAETAMLYLDLMGHDIRNHLQTVVMGTDILRHYEIGAEADPVFDLIVDSVTNSRKLIRKVQTTRGFLSAPLQTISLTDSLLQAVTIITQSFEDVKVNAQYKVLDAKIRADEYIRQLWLNLLENAVVHNMKATKWIWISLSEKFEGYQILIADNGPGIDDEKKEALFDPNRRFGGIGVHQAMKIVQKYNGTISVKDRDIGDHTQGAEFYVWFPKISNRRLTGIAV